MNEGQPPLRADAVVVAAGSSSRMAGRDKLAAPVAGRPLLAWTIGAMRASGVVERIVVVTSPERVEILRAAAWLEGVDIVTGGSRRHESVAAGVKAIVAGATPGDRVVLVHDGARPCVSPALVAEVARAAALHGAAIPVVPVAETLKRVEAGLIVATVEREGLAVAQTPQGMRLGLLTGAFERFPPDGTETWTDEAALLEACRIPVHAIPGHPDNLKVTTPVDLDRAGTILAGMAPLVGFGHDGHPFGPGGPLVLGGVEIEGAPRLHGHSDGDVALHAVADALLGAAGLGDLGRLFPADSRTPRGIASAELLREVGTRLVAAGLRPTSVDLTIVAGRPRLGARLDAMSAAIGALLDLPPERISVKASSGNLDGMEGAGRGISARAVAVVERRR